MAEEAIVKIIRKYIEKLNSTGILIDKGILFGSYSKGNSNSNSDIDLVVVSPIFDKEYSLSDVESLWEIAAKIDSRIEPIHCGVIQWERDDSSIIIEIARREGVVIHAA